MGSRKEWNGDGRGLVRLYFAERLIAIRELSIGPPDNPSLRSRPVSAPYSRCGPKKHTEEKLG